jgi:hypothetical protein
MPEGDKTIFRAMGIHRFQGTTLTLMERSIPHRMPRGGGGGSSANHGSIFSNFRFLARCSLAATFRAPCRIGYVEHHRAQGSLIVTGSGLVSVAVPVIPVLGIGAASPKSAAPRTFGYSQN